MVDKKNTTLSSDAHINLYGGFSRSIPLVQLRTSHIKGWVVTPSVRAVQPPQGAPVTLSQREFELFYLLYAHEGQALTSGQIIQRIWGHSTHGDQNALRTLIKQLRRKIESRPDDPSFLFTVQDVGYQLLLDGLSRNDLVEY